MFEKIARSDFSRPTGARRARRRDAPSNPECQPASPLTTTMSNKPLIGAFLCVAEREGESTRGFDKFAGSKFARPKGARRARRRDAPSNPSVSLHHRLQQSCQISPLMGLFLCMAEREDLIRTLVRKNSPGAIFHDQREPEGRGAWTRQVIPLPVQRHWIPAKNMPERRCLNEYINLSPNDFET